MEKKNTTCKKKKIDGDAWHIQKNIAYFQFWRPWEANH